MTRDELIEAMRARCAGDRRVAAVFLGGSLGAGTGDRFSDCDFVLAVAPDDHTAFVAGLRPWVEGFTALALWRQVYPTVPLFLAVTPDYLRFDMTVTVPDRLTGAQSTWRPLLDPNGLHASLPERPSPRSPDPARIAAIVEEFWRILGLLPVGVGRGEYVVAATGVGLLRDQLVALLIEAEAPPTPPGALHLSRVLPPQALSLLEGLPPAAANRKSVIEASFACAAVFQAMARPLAACTGAAWPEALETAARAHIRRELGLELPG